ncbi:MAG: DUF6985 domain-containing protein [Fimbriiglobus sp.]
MSDKPDVLTLAGLPPLSWERGSGWRCEVVIPAWSGFSAGDGKPSTGAVSVNFGCRDVYARTPPTSGQVAAFRRLVDDAEAVRSAVLQATYDAIHDGSELDVDIEDVLGEPLVDPIQLRSAFALNVVSIADDSEGESSIDLEFDAAWDEEHGFMALLIDGRVTHVGDR